MSGKTDNNQGENNDNILTIVIIILFWIYHGDFNTAIFWFLITVLLVWLILFMIEHPWYSLLLIVLGFGSCES
ncbi:MAG: hypothetical protein KZQ64_16295 [gamma proteobacterium symbiont of Bathyaustriella thionipta]|nr:hypothetical protein [gamma proteobacterium symbiont of Bathyaustriella thionipta]MCU7950189.1 hypothetical protein [gamma proteobacterium symbiont of Bathyaustriella thionipta]MCU7954928.1 hypothetical protein [gamma proteobacterium symbiont of Bathyaustriella thionipta]MCU7958043.1 hypothetical protein [gamma proteobacterium symbiont of Bathyaustriella thionipta]MCU7967190.1 hypothetical protein [gamma proteobacterium symbiont of Bathyaustriella thionipta]